MPFTFSHPALVLPLAYLPRRFYSLTGLVMGSMIPDFEYFLRMSTKGAYGHTLAGVFWFDLPLALWIAFLFHFLVRDVLIDHLPRLLYIRLIPFKKFNWYQYVKDHWGVVCISVIIGTGSHLLWDSFTHHDGYFVKMMPVLSGNIGLFGFHIHIFKFLQYLCSLLGALVIVFVIFHLPGQVYVEREKLRSYWVWVLVFSVFILAMRLLYGMKQDFYNNLIVSAISSGLLAITLASVIVYFKTVNGSKATFTQRPQSFSRRSPR